MAEGKRVSYSFLLSCSKFSNVIRTLMPLAITDQQLEQGLSIMEDGLVSLVG